MYIPKDIKEKINKVYKDFDYNFTEPMVRLVKIIEELIDERGPVKPKWSKDGFKRCGECNAILRSTNGMPFRYCSNCGRKVLWK